MPAILCLLQFVLTISWPHQHMLLVRHSMTCKRQDGATAQDAASCPAVQDSPTGAWKCTCTWLADVSATHHECSDPLPMRPCPPCLLHCCNVAGALLCCSSASSSPVLQECCTSSCCCCLCLCCCLCHLNCICITWLKAPNASLVCLTVPHPSQARQKDKRVQKGSNQCNCTTLQHQLPVLHCILAKPDLFKARQGTPSWHRLAHTYVGTVWPTAAQTYPAVPSASRSHYC